MVSARGMRGSLGLWRLIGVVVTITSEFADVVLLHAFNQHTTYMTSWGHGGAKRAEKARYDPKNVSISCTVPRVPKLAQDSYGRYPTLYKELAR
jgi:hypothetical protein